MNNRGEFDLVTVLVYVIVAISGASGGCLVVAHNILHGRSLTQLYVLSYGFVGLVFAVAGVIAIELMTPMSIGMKGAVIYGLILGATGAAALGSANLSARIIMKKLGIEIEIKLKDSKRKK